MKKNQGKVYLVGGGPGDPGLITVRGAQLLNQADIVFYDHLANEALLNYTLSRCQKIFVGKKGGALQMSQDQIEQKMIREAQKGKTIVRLKGGDPFIFGRGGEEAVALSKAGIHFEVVPGVTSVSSVPAYAGIPLTHRDFTADVAIVTGHETGGGSPAPTMGVHWNAVAQMGTVVILMGLANLRENVRRLMEHGKSPQTPSAAISWGTLTRQKTVVGVLEALPDLVDKEKLQPPVVVVIGSVVGLKDKLDWFEQKPLFGKKVLITRSALQADTFRQELESAGVQVFEIPTISVLPPASFTPLDRALRKIGDYDWIVFASVNAVHFFWKRFEKIHRDVRALGSIKIAAIGSSTAGELKKQGLSADLIPRRYQASSLIAELKRKKMKKVLLLQGNLADQTIYQALIKMGAHPHRVEAYRTVVPKKSAFFLKEFFGQNKPDWIPFLSSSAVENFVKMMGQNNIINCLQGVRIACIGPVTQKTAQKFGLKVDVVPRKATVVELVQAMSEIYREPPESA